MSINRLSICFKKDRINAIFFVYEWLAKLSSIYLWRSNLITVFKQS